MIVPIDGLWDHVTDPENIDEVDVWGRIYGQQMYLDRHQRKTECVVSMSPQMAIMQAINLSRSWTFEHKRTRGVLPLPACLSLRRKRGDCKDFAIAAGTLLMVAGLQIAFVLISRENGTAGHIGVTAPGWGVNLEIPQILGAKTICKPRLIMIPSWELNKKLHLKVKRLNGRKEHRFLASVEREYRPDGRKMLEALEVRNLEKLEKTSEADARGGETCLFLTRRAG